MKKCSFWTSLFCRSWLGCSLTFVLWNPFPFRRFQRTTTFAHFSVRHPLWPLNDCWTLHAGTSVYFNGHTHTHCSTAALTTSQEEITESYLPPKVPKSGDQNGKIDNLDWSTWAAPIKSHCIPWSYVSLMLYTRCVYNLRALSRERVSQKRYEHLLVMNRISLTETLKV
jgi:hypothetical protein